MGDLIRLEDLNKAKTQEERTRMVEGLRDLLVRAEAGEASRGARMSSFRRIANAYRSACLRRRNAACTRLSAPRRS